RTGSDRLGDAVEDTRSFDARDLGPRAVIESPAGGRDGPVEILRATRRLPSDDDVMRRAHPLRRPTVGGVDPSSVDEILVITSSDGLGHERDSLTRTPDEAPARAAATRRLRRGDPGRGSA